MVMDRLQGVFPALITPMKPDESIDFKSLEKLIKYLLRNEVSGFYCGGSTGEGIILDLSERKQLLECVINSSNQKAAVIAHVGTLRTVDAIELAVHAEQSGADVVSAIVPFYYSLTEQAIIDHYRQIMEAVSLPLIIYHFPQATGVTLSMHFYEKMASFDQCMGVKFTSHNMYELQQIQRICKDNFIVYNGHDEVYAAGALMGATGAIGSTFNIMPGAFVSMFRSLQEKNWEEVRKIQIDINTVIEHMLGYDVIAYEKYISCLQGIIETPTVRKPLMQLQENEKQDVQTFYENSNILRGTYSSLDTL